jgi:hypothetical protein
MGGISSLKEALIADGGPIGDMSGPTGGGAVVCWGEDDLADEKDASE